MDIKMIGVSEGGYGRKSISIRLEKLSSTLYIEFFSGVIINDIFKLLCGYLTS